MSDVLYDQHRAAAEASGGISDGPIYDLVLRLCRGHQVAGDLLDFGAGTGTLLRLLRDAGFPVTATGADILPRPAELPADTQWVECDLNQPLPLPSGAFDVIVSSEVIEHLENPRAMFRDLFRVLRPGGLLILTTPNQASLRSLLALVLTGHFLAFRDRAYPAHITALLRTDLSRICAETGFAPPEFAYTARGGVPKAGNLTWQGLSFGLLRGRLFSDNLAVVTRKV